MSDLLEWLLVAPGRGQRSWVNTSTILVQPGDEGLGAVLHVVWGADFYVDMWGAGAAGVAGGHDLLACGDGVAGGYEGLGAVAVGPSNARAVGGGEADAAGVAVAAAVGAAAFVPPVVVPGAGGGDDACVHGVDGCACRDDPVPGGVFGVRFVDG